MEKLMPRNEKSDKHRKKTMPKNEKSDKTGKNSCQRLKSLIRSRKKDHLAERL
jgi:hypothetical protein